MRKLDFQDFSLSKRVWATLSQCNSDNVTLYFSQSVPPAIHFTDSIDFILHRFNRVIVDALKVQKEENEGAYVSWGNEERWTRLLHKNDHKKIWKSIGWDGTLEEKQVDKPSDEEFRMHFENLLNPPVTEPLETVDISNSPHVPNLDDPIDEKEVEEAAKSSKESKSFIGMTPAIFKCFPTIWILYVTQILNLVFNQNVSFPVKWCYNKLIVLFKKGARLLCGNYRGISIGTRRVNYTPRY